MNIRRMIKDQFNGIYESFIHNGVPINHTDMKDLVQNLYIPAEGWNEDIVSDSLILVNNLIRKFPPPIQTVTTKWDDEDGF